MSKSATIPHQLVIEMLDDNRWHFDLWSFEVDNEPIFTGSADTLLGAVEACRMTVEALKL